VLDYLALKQPGTIQEAEWTELLQLLAPVSESYLRHLLHDTAVPVEQPFAGIRQSSFELLEESLLEMHGAYAAALAVGDRARAAYCRRLIIEAKDHARMAARSAKTSPEKKAQKDEMIQWMLVWLENPEVFPVWVKLRKRAAGLETGGPGNGGVIEARSIRP